MTTSIASIAAHYATDISSSEDGDVAESAAELIPTDNLRHALVAGGLDGTDAECEQLRYAVALEIRAKADDRRKRLWVGNRMVAAVHAWFDDGAFSVSLVDADGDEIKCIGGADNSDEAVKLAVSEAQRRSVQAVFAPRAGEKSVQWRP